MKHLTYTSFSRQRNWGTMIQANCWHQRRLWLKLWVSLLREGVHVLGESVDYLWIAEDNSGFKSGSPLVMWARVGLRHFSETVSPYEKWNGYYLPCSKSSDCWGWSVEVAGRRLARRRPWQSGSRLLKAHVVACPLLRVSDNFLTVKNESCSCVRQSSFWRLLFFNLKGEKV